MTDVLAQPVPARRRRDLRFLRWIGSRLLFAAVVVVVLSIVVFVATSVMPVNAVDHLLGAEGTPEGRAALMRELGLDRGPVERYFAWVADVLRLDFGKSLYTHEPVWPLVSQRLGNSLLLGLGIIIAQTPLALFLGIWTALHAGSFTDRAVSTGVLIFICVPEFVAGIFLIWLLSVKFPIFPALSILTAQSTASQWFWALCLPVLAMTPVGTSYLIRTMRYSVVEVLDKEFVRMASLRGLSQSRVILRHVLPNALIPMINVLALHVAFLLSGVVAVEVLFQYPGIGRLLLDAVSQQDVPLVQAVAVVLGSGYVLINLVADICMALLDPRIGNRTA